MEVNGNGKHSSLLQYGNKILYNEELQGKEFVLF
jgi:hypothetical protein